MVGAGCGCTDCSSSNDVCACFQSSSLPNNDMCAVLCCVVIYMFGVGCERENRDTSVLVGTM